MSAKIISALNDYVSEFLQKFDNQEQLDLWTSDDNQKAFTKVVSSLVNKKLKKMAKKEDEEKEPRPKKGKTAYLFFCSAERGNMKKKYPDLTNKEITKKLGEKWTSIKDDKDKIKIYKDMAEEDKERFEQEKTDMGITEKPKKTKKIDGGVKKNKSAYIFFCQQERTRIKEENPEMKGTEIMSELGKRWKELGDEEKKVFQEQADGDKERYLQQKQDTGNDSEKEKEVKKTKPKKKKEQKNKEESEDENDEKPKKRRKIKKIVVEDSDDEGAQESKGEEESKSDEQEVEVDKEREEKIARIKATPPMTFIKYFKSNNAGINMKELGVLAKKNWAEMSVDEKIEFL
ncbi:hypothetical protein EBU94_02395 [bacterium]|nr:hypothetical protein [bacterium]